MIFLLIQPFAVLSCKFEEKKNLMIFYWKSIFFLQKWSNLQERSAISWIKRIIKFQIFIFRVMVIFVMSSPQFSWKIHRKLGWWHYKNDHNSKNKNRRNLKVDYSFDSADCESFLWFWLLLHFYFKSGQIYMKDPESPE